jgi:integrase
LTPFIDNRTRTPKPAEAKMMLFMALPSVTASIVVSRKVTNRKAMPFANVEKIDRIESLTLRFLILTGVRAVEVRRCKWEQIDRAAAL